MGSISLLNTSLFQYVQPGSGAHSACYSTGVEIPEIFPRGNPARAWCLSHNSIYEPMLEMSAAIFLLLQYFQHVTGATLLYFIPTANSFIPYESQPTFSPILCRKIFSYLRMCVRLRLQSDSQNSYKADLDRNFSNVKCNLFPPHRHFS
jgi:hypothetical protein